jgi:uncharacterized protein YbaA (DUF1428 family)
MRPVQEGDVDALSTESVVFAWMLYQNQDYTPVAFHITFQICGAFACP